MAKKKHVGKIYRRIFEFIKAAQEHQSLQNYKINI